MSDPNRRSAAQKAATARRKDEDAARVESKERYCRARAEHFTHTKACAESGLKRGTVESWRVKDPDFVAATDDAIEEYVDSVEQVLADVAKGIRTDVKSVQIKAFLAFLNANRKSKYTYLSKHEVTGAGGKDLVLTVKLPEGFGT